MVGDVGNTVLFGFFAFVALRQVGGRWDELGGATAPAAGRPVPSSPSPPPRRCARSTCSPPLAEQQQTADIYKPYHNSLTDSQGLFSIVALQAAERQRQRLIKESAAAAAARTGRRPRINRSPSISRRSSCCSRWRERQRKPGVPEPDTRNRPDAGKQSASR